MPGNTSVGICIAFILACLFGAAFLLGDSYQANERVQDAELSLYCDMVSLRKITQDDTVGWPDYKGIYEQYCVQPKD